MECIMFSIATGFLQRSWLWFYMMCPTESSIGFFLDVITFLQSFIFTETTKEKISCILSHLCTLFHLCLLWFPSSPSFSSCPALPGTTGDLERPCGPMLLMHKAMEKWSLLCLCVWYKICGTFLVSGIPQLYRFLFLLHSIQFWGINMCPWAFPNEYINTFHSKSVKSFCPRPTLE